MLDKRINPPLVVKYIYNKYQAGYSPVVLICGKMRTGKTTKAFVIANILSYMIFNRSWNWKKNTIVSMDQFIEKMRDNDTEILVIDECQRIFGRKLWYTQDSILFDTLLTSQAYKHYIIILILPTASNLGMDHAINVNYVIPLTNRTLCQPYEVKSNEWDITLKQKKLERSGLGHFKLDIKAEPIKSVFSSELLELEAYKNYISKEIKEKIMAEAVDKKHKAIMKKRVDDLNRKILYGEL